MSWGFQLLGREPPVPVTSLNFLTLAKFVKQKNNITEYIKQNYITRKWLLTSPLPRNPKELNFSVHIGLISFCMFNFVMIEDIKK